MSHIRKRLGIGLFVLGCCAALAAGNEAVAAVMSVSSTFPTVDNADIGQNTGASDIGGDEGHIWSNRPVQGQVFKTGSNPGGYLLNATTLQNYNNTTTSGTFEIRIGSLGTVSGTVLNDLRYETGSNTVSYTPGQYVTGTLSTPIWLRPNSYYGFDWGTTGAGFVTQNNLDTGGDVYADGKAYSSGTNSTPGATVTLRNGDRVFHLDMVQAAPPVSNGKISVNFATGASSPWYVTGTAGVKPLANWNNVALTQLVPSGTNVQLRDSAGNATTATITYSATNTWETLNGSTATDDGRLMKGYLDTGNDTNAISISVSDLGLEFTHRPGYDVIVYCDTDGAGTRGFRITDSTGYTTERWLLEGSTSYDFGFSPQNMGFVQGDYLTEAAAAQSGVFANYVVLSGLHGSSFTLTMLNGSTGDVRSRINGFQIIANIPEPSTVTLLGFGVACLLGGLGRRLVRRTR